MSEAVKCVCGAVPRQITLYPQEHLTDMFCIECACGVRGSLELCGGEAIRSWDDMWRARKHFPAVLALLKRMRRAENDDGRVDFGCDLSGNPISAQLASILRAIEEC